MYLISLSRYSEANEVFKKIAKFNKKTETYDLTTSQIQDNLADAQKDDDDEKEAPPVMWFLT